MLEVGKLESVGDLIVKASARFRGASAIGRTHPSTDSWSYQELAGQVGRAARLLRSLGLDPGDRVLLVLGSSPEWVLAFFTVLHAGLVVVPVPPDTAPESLPKLAAHVNARAAITDEATHDRTAQLDLLRITTDELERASDPPVVHLVVPRSSLAILAFTSGTTAEPRAVELSHENLLTDLEALLRVRRAGPGDAFLSVLPLAHLFELVVGLLAPLACGARVVYASALLPNRLMNALRADRITHVLAVPALLECFYETALGYLVDDTVVTQKSRERPSGPVEGVEGVETSLSPRWLAFLRSNLRKATGQQFHTLIIGGAALKPAWARILSSLGIDLEVGYGLTEAGPVVAVGSTEASVRGSVGKPLPGIAVRIESDGEILVRGANVMRGYHKDPDATMRAVRDGWLRTGDSGYLDHEGFLFVTGRLKEIMVTSSGETMHPEEIERYYENLLFAESCVAPVRDDNGNDVPTLFAVPASPDLSDAALQEAFQEMRAAAPACYRVKRMIRIGAPLPRSPLGKIQRRILAEQVNQN